MVGYTAKKEVVITPSQGFVLRFVAKNNSANVKAITQALNITSSAATQLVDGLVHKGYLVRKDNPMTGELLHYHCLWKLKKKFKEFKEQGLRKMIEVFKRLYDEELTQ